MPKMNHQRIRRSNQTRRERKQKFQSWGKGRGLEAWNDENEPAYPLISKNTYEPRVQTPSGQPRRTSWCADLIHHTMTTSKKSTRNEANGITAYNKQARKAQKRDKTSERKFKSSNSRKWAHELLRNSKILAITKRRAGGTALSRLPDKSKDHPLWQNLQRAEESSRRKEGKIIKLIDIMPGDIVIVWRDLEAKIKDSRNWFMAEVEVTPPPTRDNQEFSNLKVIDVETGVSHWINKKLAQKVFIKPITPEASWCAN